MRRRALWELLDVLPDAHIVVSPMATVELLNEAALPLFGLEIPPTEPIDACDWLPIDSVALVLNWLRAREKRAPLTFMVRGGPMSIVNWVVASLSPIHLEERPAFLLSLKPATGPELPESDEVARHRLLLETAALRGIGIYEHNHLSGRTYASGEARAQFGLGPADDFDLENLAESVHPEDRDYFQLALRKSQNPLGTGMLDVRHRVVTPLGETRWLHTCSRTRFASDESTGRFPSVTMGSVVDITEAMERQNANQRLAAVMAATPDLVAITDFSGRLAYLNPAGRRLVGLSEAAPVSNYKTIDLLQERYRDRFIEEVLPSAIDHGSWIGELQLCKPKKEEGVPVELVLLAHKPNRSMGAYLSVIAHDLTNKKSLEAQLLHSQKLEAIGRLAGGVAHDFNNLLSVIVGFTSIVQDDSGLTKTSKLGLEEIMRASDRAAKLTGQLLSFSRKQVLRPKVIDVDSVLQSMFPMLERLLGERVVLSYYPSEANARIEADPTQLEQVIMNLAVNARDAMKGEGRLTIEVEIHRVSRAGQKHPVELSAGEHVLIAVSDTGEGMDEETRSRIFEPFFTTKPQGSGTGLGLATVFGIVNQSGGRIWVHSEPGHGSSFRLAFPRCQAPLTSTDSVSWHPKRHGEGRILVVEDDIQLRKVLVAILEKAGYETIAPVGPVEALALARSGTNDLALLLTDVMMPQMTGKQLADALKAADRTLPVLYMSGYTEESIVRDGVLAEGINLISKPISPADLLDAVQATLLDTNRKESLLPGG